MLLAAVFGCAGGGVSGPQVPPSGLDSLGVDREDRPFLLEPMRGYPLVVESARQEEIWRLFDTLVEAGDRATAQAGAVVLLDADPGFHPALVLEAQVDFVSGRKAAVGERLRPVAAELPSYLAAQMLLGRAAEGTGDLGEAYAAYRAVAPASSLAAVRAAAVFEGAVQAEVERLDDALARLRFEDAEKGLELLRIWAPAADSTLAAGWRLAAAQGDPTAELEALEALLGVRGEDRELLERQAELELETGDPRAGVEILRRLTAAHPDDSYLLGLLEEAKLAFRISLLPARVRGLRTRQELARGEYAVLLYWLMPGVRYGRTTSARIAADILDHPDREQIARVINMDLMGVDETLHRFAPERPVTRVEALRSLLRALSADPAPACLGPVEWDPAPSDAWVCRTAARCAMTASEADCLPSAPVSGAEALALIHRGLRLLGG